MGSYDDGRLLQEVGDRDGTDVEEPFRGACKDSILVLGSCSSRVAFACGECCSVHVAYLRARWRVSERCFQVLAHITDTPGCWTHGFATSMFTHGSVYMVARLSACLKHFHEKLTFSTKMLPSLSPRNPNPSRSVRSGLDKRASERELVAKMMGVYVAKAARRLSADSVSFGLPPLCLSILHTLPLMINAVYSFGARAVET